MQTISLDKIIRIDRSVRPIYPKEARICDPELESVGPEEYELSKLELSLHPGQQNGRLIVGNLIYKHLKESDLLKSCLGLEDALEIAKSDVSIFQNIFQNHEALICWRSVARFAYSMLGRTFGLGKLHVPCVYVGYGLPPDREKKMMTWWTELDWRFDSHKPAAFYPEI